MGNTMLDEVFIPFVVDELELFDIGPPPKPDTSESSNGGEDRSEPRLYYRIPQSVSRNELH